ncbi:MAG: hypothetical protein NVS1B4_08300 [Gemmatimonadaceae bacterium]
MSFSGSTGTVITHLFQAAHKISGRVLWGNLQLLFWLSLVPFVTSWRGQNHSAPLTTALYGVVLLLCGVAFSILQAALIGVVGQDATLARAVDRDVKGKLSLGLYVVTVGLAFIRP